MEFGTSKCTRRREGESKAASVLGLAGSFSISPRGLHSPTELLSLSLSSLSLSLCLSNSTHNTKTETIQRIFLLYIKSFFTSLLVLHFGIFLPSFPTPTPTFPIGFRCLGTVRLTTLCFLCFVMCDLCLFFCSF